MKKYTKLIIIVLSAICLCIISFCIYSSDMNRAVTVSINNIQNDTEYLESAYIDYNTKGKKVISCDILIKNYSFYNIQYLELKSDNFDCILTGSQFEDLQLIDVTKFHKKVIPCFLLVDESLTEKDLQSILSNSYLEVWIENSDNDSCELKIDRVS